MNVIDPGHVYDLDWLDGKPRTSVEGHVIAPENRLVFVKREGDGYPGNVGHHPGTNLQDVLRALIDRVSYLNRQIPHVNNVWILVNLRRSVWLLEQRAAERHGRKFDVPVPSIVDTPDVKIEALPICSGCGHIGCEGSCRR